MVACFELELYSKKFTKTIEITKPDESLTWELQFKGWRRDLR